MNADDTAFIGATDSPLGINVFSYCENNSINMKDQKGNFPVLIFIAGVVMGVTLIASSVSVTLPLSVSMFDYAQRNKTNYKKLSIKQTNKKFGSLLKKSLKKATEIKTRINNCIKYIKQNRKTKKTIKKEIFFSPSNISDMDLALSIGHADNCTVKVEKTSMFKNGKRRYNVTINLKDLYDFDPADEKDAWWVAQLKNFGYSVQKTAKVKPYWWRTRFTYAVYRKD